MSRLKTRLENINLNPIDSIETTNYDGASVTEVNIKPLFKEIDFIKSFNFRRYRWLGYDWRYPTSFQ